jgi:hypothetical protein
MEVADLATRVAAHGGRDIELIEQPAPEGSTERRSQVSLARGLPPTLDWYWANDNLAPKT